VVSGRVRKSGGMSKIFDPTGNPVPQQEPVEASRDRKVFTFTPLHGNVHIEKQKVSDLKTNGGLFVPDDVDDRAAVFRVVAVGPGFIDVTKNDGSRLPMSVSVGDLVLVDLGQVRNIGYGGQTVYVCQDPDILGKVTFETVKTDA
jgi:chaperonin GroES